MSFHQLATILSGFLPLAPAALLLVFIERRAIFAWCAKRLNKQLHSIPWLENLIVLVNCPLAFYLGYLGRNVLMERTLDYLSIVFAILLLMAVHRVRLSLQRRVVDLRTVAQSEWINALVKEVLAKQDRKV